MTFLSTPVSNLLGRSLRALREGSDFSRMNCVNFVNLASNRELFLNETAFPLAPSAPFRNCPAHD